ncbi:hypothetical protein D3C87_2178850 [compost metagenome]
MVDALERVIQPGERGRLAAAAAEGAARYGLQVAVERYWDVIRLVLKMDDRVSR